MSRPALVHLVREPGERVDGPLPLLVLLHGVGSHEADLFGLAPYLDPRFLVLSARGPFTLAPGAYAWFEVVFTPEPVHNAAQAAQSCEMLMRFIDESVEAYGADPARVYFMGFSQGAIIGLATALTEPSRIAGVVAMSGRLLPEIVPQIDAEAVRGLPLLVQHGTLDPVLPLHHGRNIRDVLARYSVDVTYREYPMGHQISDESLADALAWLRARLDAPDRRTPAG